MTTPTRPEDAKEEAAPAEIGHNNPPAFDVEKHKDTDKRVVEFLDATKDWLDLKQIESEAQAKTMGDQISGLRALHKDIEEERKAAAKPHDDGKQAVQDAYKPLLEQVSDAGKKLKAKMDAWLTALARKEAEEKRKAEELARIKRMEAEEAERKAQAENDIRAQKEAEKNRKAAEKEIKKAAKPVKAQARSASGAGRTLSQRKVKEVEITNAKVLFLRYENHPDVLDLLRRLATQEVRGKDYVEGSIGGIKVTERTVTA